MRNIFKTAFAMFLMCSLFSTTSYSATVTPNGDGNAVLSVSGLSWTIGPNYQTNWETIYYGPYDVYFDAGPYNDVVLGHSDVTFDINEAYQAANQLAGAINDYNDTAETKIALVDNGQGSGFPTFAQIPAAVYATNVDFRKFNYANLYGYWEWYPDSSTYVMSRDYSAQAWAVFHTSSVPIPGALWLLGSGLIGIVGIRRKIKN